MPARIGGLVHGLAVRGRLLPISRLRRLAVSGRLRIIGLAVRGLLLSGLSGVGRRGLRLLRLISGRLVRRRRGRIHRLSLFRRGRRGLTRTLQALLRERVIGLKGEGLPIRGLRLIRRAQMFQHDTQIVAGLRAGRLQFHGPRQGLRGVERASLLVVDAAKIQVRKPIGRVLLNGRFQFCLRPSGNLCFAARPILRHVRLA